MTAGKLIIFSDFDGTITTHDTGTTLIDLGMGYDRRRELDMDILHGRRSFRDAVAEMWDAVGGMSWNEALEVVDQIPIDPGFPEFRSFTQTQHWPLIILSRFRFGLQPISQISGTVSGPVLADHKRYPFPQMIVTPVN